MFINILATEKRGTISLVEIPRFSETTKTIAILLKLIKNESIGGLFIIQHAV